ncbi:ABC transporter substrate-binding protein [Roseomonas stagni]|uniref:ABC transporter substrate-binding protein n=1 Tax=Falsiroseomonas algicola TaxID=2716930 RepID=A0A6M1LFJ3_9PROT|nr:ABC transporter substrate-binding protein [Falsiroseomonas algicola]NGM19020.1 ABC transporter substrate-binding protein [Falsiroseomonas algicola]
MAPTRRHLLSAAAILLAAPAAAQGQARLVRHAQGETAVPADPQRIVVFDIAALDILDALGVERIQGVAGTTFPPFLSRYADARYARLGTLFEPNYEAVNAARPDLIVIGGRSAAKYADLSRIAPTIVLHGGTGGTIDRVEQNALMLAGIVGREAAARAAVAGLRDAVAATRARAAGQGKALVVLTTGTRMSAYGPGSRFGVIHDELGVAAAVPDLAVSSHGQAVGSEFILAANPDRLFVVDRDAAIGRSGAARRLLDNPLVRQTAAWRQGRVYYLDPVTWYVAPGGLQGTTLMVREVAAALGAA